MAEKTNRTNPVAAVKPEPTLRIVPDLPPIAMAPFAGAVAQLALQWQQQRADPHSRLREIVHGAVGVVPGCEHAAMVVYDGNGVLVAKATTGPETTSMIALQNQLGEGPCRDTAAMNAVFRCADVATEARWARFAIQAQQLGIASMLCTPLMVGARSFGSLSMASGTPNAFDDESEVLASIFATHAAIALADAERLETLEIAVETRDLIGQAKGILMQRYNINAEAAFSVLVRESKDNNIKLRTISQILSTTGKLPSDQ